MLEKFLDTMTELVFREDPIPERADIIFIPGNGFPQMAEHAARLWREGRAPWVLPSGKYSVTDGKFMGVREKADLYSRTYRTEWEFLRDVLLCNQVDASAILKEEEATFTYENAVYSRKAVKEAGLSVKKAILCCRNIHGGRALLYYQKEFPETEFFVAPSVIKGITKENWRKTKEGVAAVTGEITRIVSQYVLYM